MAAYQLAKVVDALAQNCGKAEVESTLNLFGDCENRSAERKKNQVKMNSGQDVCGHHSDVFEHADKITGQRRHICASQEAEGVGVKVAEIRLVLMVGRNGVRHGEQLRRANRGEYVPTLWNSADTR